jgi:surface antigen
MHSIARPLVMGCLLLAGMAGTAEAQYLDTLATSPMSRFNEADNMLFKANLDKALASGSDGVTLAWKNERTPAAGSVTLQKSFDSKGMKCRELLIANSYKTLKGEGVHTFCQNSAGEWKLVD